ncbi:hypothetical protein KUCAC02_018347, partial [Chaenocephalus aceratus]
SDNPALSAPSTSPSPATLILPKASACQGSLCSPLAGTQACALKLSPPPTAASAGATGGNGCPPNPKVMQTPALSTKGACVRCSPTPTTNLSAPTPASLSPP